MIEDPSKLDISIELSKNDFKEELECLKKIIKDPKCKFETKSLAYDGRSLRCKEEKRAFVFELLKFLAKPSRTFRVFSKGIESNFKFKDEVVILTLPKTLSSSYVSSLVKFQIKSKETGEKAFTPQAAKMSYPDALQMLVNYFSLHLKDPEKVLFSRRLSKRLAILGLI